MKKIVLSVVAVFSLLAPALMLSRSAAVTACPVREPETLLSLYRDSDAIFIGRYNGSEEGAEIRDDDTHTAVEIKKHFDISSTLKRKALKTVTLTDSDFRYKDRKAGFETTEEVQQAQIVPETTLEELEEEMSNTMKPGDNVLLFLRIDEESKHFELTDYRDGMKNLPSEDMDVYETRIKELGSIFAAEKPDPEMIIDWLVRCAEEPATRWEGTYELQQSFNALEYKTQRDAERNEKIANDEKVEGEDIYFDEGFETGRTTIFAKLLNNY